ncbi:hypothetical protein JTB14_019422 [Gonioctena quinquepunctata]|nr:hypothetical protein JTB14_019422 [Gonioctena quinquepunctata]
MNDIRPFTQRVLPEPPRVVNRQEPPRRPDDHDDHEHSDSGLSADAPAVHNSDTDDASSPPAEEVQIVPQEDRYAPIVDQSIVRPLSRETGNFRPLSRETGIDTTLPENKTDLSLQSETAVRPEVELPAELRKRRRRCRMSAYDNIEIVPENACTSLRHDVTPVNPSVARVAILHPTKGPGDGGEKVVL